MKKNILILMLILLSNSIIHSQNVAISTANTAPDPSAMLDIVSSGSGLLIPRIALTALNAASPIISPATSLLVYNTATAGTLPNNVIPGFYYWDGVKWVSFTGPGGKDWSLLGNAGTSITTDFLGTTDAVAVAFRSNNTERMRILATGPVAINSTTTFGTSVFFSAASGTNNAIDASAAGIGDAVYGQNTGGGYGVSGLSNIATGAGTYGTNINASGTGIMGSGQAVGASYLTAGSGGGFTGSTIGVAGFATGSANNTWGGYFTNGSGVAYAYVGGRTGSTNYKINGPGTVSTIVKNTKGQSVNLYCPESPEILFQDFGKGKLINGKVHIDLDIDFSKNITVNEKHPLRVIVQLEGDCKGVYVTNQTGIGFDVKELQGGNSNVEFTYFVTANRADDINSNGSVDSKNADIRFGEAPLKQEAIKTEPKTLKGLK